MNPARIHHNDKSRRVLRFGPRGKLIEMTSWCWYRSRKPKADRQMHRHLREEDKREAQLENE
jgi:hypothetical protein